MHEINGSRQTHEAAATSENMNSSQYHAQNIQL
jgi:hypothetical protein